MPPPSPELRDQGFYKTFVQDWAIDDIQTSFKRSLSFGPAPATSFDQKAAPCLADHGDVPSKRLIICCDGTWQSSVSGLKNIPSNVTRLARSIARTGRDDDGKLWQQVVYYDAGIGTGNLSLWERDRQGGFGVGLSEKVIEAYTFLVTNYAPGDQVFCFGFSRGAYTARAVAGLVTDIGIIAPRDLQDFPELYRTYQNPDNNSFTFRQSEAYRQWVTGVRSKVSNSNDPDGSQEVWARRPRAVPAEASRFVEVVGVFDTVGSLGIPEIHWSQKYLKPLWKYFNFTDPNFHNISLSPFIKHAFHALALDEHRKPFSPTLWGYRDEDALTNPHKSTEQLLQEYRELQADTQSEIEVLSKAWRAYVEGEMHDALCGAERDLRQVWFPGVHINTGGGNKAILEGVDTDFEELALISFAWMCEQVAPYLQLEYGKKGMASLAKRTLSDRKKLIEDAKKEKDFGSWQITKPVWRALDYLGVRPAALRQVAYDIVNGWATGPIVNNFSGIFMLSGSVYRTPGEYKTDGEGRRMGATHEEIHPSVQFRKTNHPTYDPPALGGFLRQKKMVKDSDGTRRLAYEWRKGNVVIPEYLIKPDDVFSRVVASRDEAGAQFIRRIDSLVGVETKDIH